MCELKEIWLPKHCVSLKNWAMNKVIKQKIVSVNFIRALFSVLDFFTPEDGTICCPKGSTLLCCVVSQKRGDLT
jgi:hypothetical protein